MPTLLRVALFGALLWNGQPSAAPVRVVIAQLAPTQYPTLARTARISGMVEILVSVKPDGKAGEVQVLKGHAMLADAAAQSARLIQFQCSNCDEPQRTVIRYVFELGEAVECIGTDANGNAQYEQACTSK